MRGPRTIPRRSGVKLNLPTEADARSQPAYPAPYKGWNARGNIANMDPLEAIIMDNMFPGVQDVSMRRGRIDWSTGYANNIRTLIPYSGAATDRLFAATSNGIFDATGSGAVGASVTPSTNGFWSFVNFSNSGGNWLCMVNGSDAYKNYNGAAWSNPAITGVSSTALCYITAHQRRLWFIENNSMKLWYLDPLAVSGTATEFPVGAIFKKGGYLVAIGSWTVDSGSGKDDLFVIVTSNGEIAVYGGIDPSSAATWSLIGIYQAGKPLGKRPLQKYGGDLLYLSHVGLLPMTKITQSSMLNSSDEISYRIDGAFIDVAESYSANFGWQVITHESQNLLIVNVPVSSDSLSYQFVMNTITKAWCRFTAWNASCWATHGNHIYYAGGTTVYRAWTGTNDSGDPIVANVAQAYNNLGTRGQKEVTLVRPNIAFSEAVTLQMAIDADFRAFSGQTEFSYVPGSEGAIWNVDLWDTGLWGGGGQILDPTWTTVPGNLGYLHSLRMQLTTSLSEITWTSTDFAVRPAGIL